MTVDDVGFVVGGIVASVVASLVIAGPSLRAVGAALIGCLAVLAFCAMRANRNAA